MGIGIIFMENEMDLFVKKLRNFTPNHPSGKYIPALHWLAENIF